MGYFESLLFYGTVISKKHNKEVREYQERFNDRTTEMEITNLDDQGYGTFILFIKDSYLSSSCNDDTSQPGIYGTVDAWKTSWRDMIEQVCTVNNWDHSECDWHLMTSLG